MPILDERTQCQFEESLHANVYTLRQHGFGCVAEAQYRLLSRRLSYLRISSWGSFLIITIPRKGSLPLSSGSIVKLVRGVFHSVLTKIQRQMKQRACVLLGVPST